MPNWITSLILLMILVVSPAHGESQWFETRSAAHQTALLELFVSQGCGRCPPAEHFVRDMQARVFDADALAVLIYHVDYLDAQKNWIDRFARPEFTARQSFLARLNLFNTIYTPEFVLGGEVIHDWQTHFERGVRWLNRLPAGAEIHLRAQVHHQRLVMEARASATDVSSPEHARLWLALTESQVSSAISGGDNVGQTLQHPTLVRYLSEPMPVDDHPHHISIEIDPEWQLSRLSVIAFVQDIEAGFVLQSVALSMEP